MNQTTIHDFIVESKCYKIEYDAEDRLIGANLKQHGTWEKWQIELYSKILRPESFCLDIGGNVGTNALAMAHYASQGQVYSFEPVPHTYALLAANAERNGVHLLHTENIGIADRNGTVPFIFDPTMLGNAHQISAEVAEKVAAGERFQTFEVRLETLDDWLCARGLGSPDFIKVDVEGYELEVLKGGRSAIRNNDRLTSIWELSVPAQREAGNTIFPKIPKDVNFILELLSIFRYSFFIGRDGQLHSFESYAHLRCLMLSGYPVEDIFCCQLVPPAVQSDIAPSFAYLPSQTGLVSLGRDTAAITLNRTSDGWSLPSLDIDGTRSGVFISVQRRTSISLMFEGLAQSGGPVLVMHNNQATFVSTEKPARIDLSLEPGNHWIFLESERKPLAHGANSGAGDARQVGFRFDINIGSTKI